MNFLKNVKKYSMEGLFDGATMSDMCRSTEYNLYYGFSSGKAQLHFNK